MSALSAHDELPWTGPSRIRPVHATVPGRARLHVSGLKRSPRLRERIERGLAGRPGVRTVSASPATGNLLVRFDPAVPLGRVTSWLEALLRTPATAGAEDAATPWHALAPTAVAATLATSAEVGLSTAEAKARRARHGSNAVLPPARRSSFAILAEQLASLPVALLAAAATLALVTGGGALEAGAIACVLVLNGAIAFVTEERAERTIAGLAAPGGRGTARLIRDGRELGVAAEAVVPGDLLLLRRGDLVPADARLVAARDLTADEAALTGESLPVAKSPDAVRAPVPLADRTAMVYRGTAVTGGAGRALVVATGAGTEVGRIQRLIQEARAPETPLQRQLAELGRRLVWLSLAVCGVVLALALLRGRGLLPALRAAVSLAVAAVPEGLPTVATTTLAIGVEAMRRRGVLIRRLGAIETLASVGVLCLDKTGTLTLNRMALAAVAFGGEAMPYPTPADGNADPRLVRLLEIGALCSETILTGATPELTGSATENALVQAALAAGIDVAALRQRHPRLDVRHRSEAYRFMATTHRRPDGLLVAVKGSPAEVLGRCTHELGTDGGIRPLTPATRTAIARANRHLADDALRVLGFACKDVPPDPPAATADGLAWVGLAGLADPIRPGARALIDAFRRAGVRPVMVTGDQAATARAVATRLGLGEDGTVEIVDAALLDRLPPDALAAAARRAHVFARVSPAQKLKIVRALQQAGEVVAMTGDGINDSPALKAADVGIALGGAGSTDAAREIADVVLRQDDLAALAAALEQGRTTYANVRKAVRYLLGTNLSEILVVLGAAVAGLGEPLGAMPLLWINLVSDVLPALGLAFEPPEPGAAAGPRPRDEPIVRRRDLAALAGDGALIGTSALAAYGWGAARHGTGQGSPARTMAFASLVTAQLLHALTCRHGRPTLPGGAALANRPLAATLALSFAAQGLMLLAPAGRRLLGVTPLGPLDLAVATAAGVLPYLANEARKLASAPANGTPTADRWP